MYYCSSPNAIERNALAVFKLLAAQKGCAFNAKDKHGRDVATLATRNVKKLGKAAVEFANKMKEAHDEEDALRKEEESKAAAEAEAAAAATAAATEETQAIDNAEAIDAAADADADADANAPQPKEEEVIAAENVTNVAPLPGSIPDDDDD